jgi:hypothetical protein
LPSLKEERIESVKVGVIAALAFVCADLVFVLFHSFILSKSIAILSQLRMDLDWQFCLREAIAWVSGFLFGVTYRYIIRDDDNPHLKDGAVLAFGIVRGLALLEAKGIFSDRVLQPDGKTIVYTVLANRFLSSAILGVESIVCFAIARFIVDLALHKKWIKLFTIDTPQR